ncbi:MAG: UbiA family prenyltransferase, partial [Rickettsiales bacterium]|nr:UbiA family prenyltransferase [Rickettsiales bacterium]
MPDKLRQYISLCRLDRPTGIWLLLWPCLWAILLSSTSPTVALKLMVLFAAGAVFMRSAGCIINDIIDRKLDRQVARTRSRPLASGAISIKEAVTLCLFLLLLAFGILLLLNRLAIIIGVLSLIPIALYPYMKRWTKWPQAFLGLTFNIG